MSLQSWLQTKRILLLAIEGAKIPASTNWLESAQVSNLNCIAHHIDIYALFRKQHY